MNTESAFAHINPYMYLHCSLDEHAVTESAYTCIVCMYELLTIIKICVYDYMHSKFFLLNIGRVIHFYCVFKVTVGFRNRLTL